MQWVLSPQYFNFPLPITLTMIHMGFSGAVAFFLVRVFKVCYGIFGVVFYFGICYFCWFLVNFYCFYSSMLALFWPWSCLCANSVQWILLSIYCNLCFDLDYLLHLGALRFLKPYLWYMHVYMLMLVFHFH